MKKLIIALLILLGNQTIAQYDPDALAILDAMSMKYKSIEGFYAEFSQNLKNVTAGLDETIRGKITVKKDKYVLDVVGQKIYNDGENIYTYNAEVNEVTISTYDNTSEEISLNNIYDIYKSGFKYGIYEVIEGVSYIDLDPEDRSDKSYFKIRMEIDTTNNLKAFSVFEPSGNVYRYTISNFLEKKSISDSFFTFDSSAYDGIEILDFR